MALLALWLARLALVFSQGDVFDYEEFAKAALGRAMRDDLGIEHYRLAYHYYEVGGFVFSHLDALSMWLFGSTVLAVKLVALTWHSFTLVVVMLLAFRAYGVRGAALSALIFILPPESLQKLSLLALGIHFEAILFHAAILLLAGRIAVDGATRRRDFAALGLACGFGLAFNLTTLAACVVALFAVLLRARRALRNWRWAGLIAGVLVGLSPWLWMANQVGSAILDLHGNRLGSGLSWPEVWDRLRNLADSVLSDRSPLDLLDLVFRGVLVGWGLTTLLSKVPAERAWSRILAAHFFVFIAAYIASRLAVGRVHHYNEFARPSVLFLPICLMSAGVLARSFAASNPWRPRLAWAAVGALAFFGMRSLVVSLGPVPITRWGESAASLATTSGCTYGQAIAELYKHLEGSPQERIETLSRLTDPAPALIKTQVMSEVLGWTVLSLEEGLRLCRSLGGEDWKHFALGLGHQLHREAQWNRARIPSILARYTPEEQQVLAEAGGRYANYKYSVLAAFNSDLQEAIQAHLPEAWFEGLGVRLAHIHLIEEAPYHQLRSVHPGYDLSAGRAIIAAQPKDVRAALERGWLRTLELRRRL